MLAAAADQAVIVSTPEPTSIADAHAAIGRFGRLTVPPRLRVLVNQAASASEAADVLDRLVASSRQFLGAVVSPLGTGSIRADPHVPLAVRGRKPFLTAFPGSVASRGVRRLARALGQGTPSAGPQPPRRLLRGPRRTLGIVARGQRLTTRRLKDRRGKRPSSPPAGPTEPAKMILAPSRKCLIKQKKG